MHNSVNTLKSTGLEILFFLHVQTALFIYFWLCWVLLLHRLLCSCRGWAALIAVCGLLITMASLVAEQRL